MKILFIYAALPKGGIETFFLRISKLLDEAGYEVNFLFFSDNSDEELLNELKKYATVFNINDYLYFRKITQSFSPIIKLLFPIRRKKIFNDILKDVSHVHGPDYNSILYYHKLYQTKEKIRVSFSTGVYHINEYNFVPFNKFFFGKKILGFIKKFPYQNILFFNEISRDFYNKIFHNNFKDSTITPIGIDLTKYSGSTVGFQNNKVVSVGRLTNWKKYNFQMIEVVQSLKRKNVLIKYDSYGDGEQLALLNKKVEEYGLKDLISFHPSIPYSNFKETIKDSLVFIGAGTALIEASACGIPALIGIENEPDPITYGFLHETRTYSYQEHQLQYPKYPIEDYILKLKNMDVQEYKLECGKAQERAQDFSIETTFRDFKQMIVASKKIDAKLSKADLKLMVLSMIANKIFFPESNYSKRL